MAPLNPKSNLFIFHERIKPVVALDQQQHIPPQDSEVLPVVVDVSHPLGDVKLQLLQVLDLRKQTQQVAAQKNT